MLGQTAYAQKLDSLLRFYQKENLFNGSVLISKNNKILINKGFGYRDAEAGQPNAPNTIFQIYSITKTFTATVILKLVQEKKISLDDKLSKFYPDFPNGESITIENLLTHTSGVYDYTRGNTMNDQTEKTFIEFVKSRPLDFMPGTEWRYSNSGYYLLGYIIEKVTSMAYENAVAMYILEPLQMDNSGFAFKYLKSPNKAKGYEILEGEETKASIIYEPPGPFAAGGIYSTVEDLYKYYKGLKNYSILSKSTLDKAYTANPYNYGYGWVVMPQFGKNTVGHSGSGAGFKSQFIQIPEDDVCIVLLSNCEKDLNNIVGNILKVLNNQPYKIPKVIELKKDEMKAYEGAYLVDNHFVLYVYRDKQKLVIQPSNQQKSILYPEKQSSFYVEELNTNICFAGKRSSYDTLTYMHDGKLIKGIRIDPSWGITGSATPNGWDGPDVKLIKKGHKNIWQIEKIQLKEGEFKFRFNDDWTINLGKAEKGNLIQDGENLRITGGVYSICLDLSKSGKAKFSLDKL